MGSVRLDGPGTRLPSDSGTACVCCCEGKSVCELGVCALGVSGSSAHPWRTPGRPGASADGAPHTGCGWRRWADPMQPAPPRDPGPGAGLSREAWMPGDPERGHSWSAVCTHFGWKRARLAAVGSSPLGETTNRKRDCSLTMSSRAFSRECFPVRGWGKWISVLQQKARGS